MYTTNDSIVVLAHANNATAYPFVSGEVNRVGHRPQH